MRGVWENKWFTIPAVAFLVCCSVLLFQVPHGDEILFFNTWRTEPFNVVFRLCTVLGEGFVYIALAIAALRWRYRFTVLIAMAGLLILPVSFILKDQIGEDRPKTYFEKQGIYDQVVVVPEVELASGRTSFPSGHTMSAFTLYSLLTLIAGRKHARWGLLFALLAIAVAVSRIFLVQHFLEDILAGAIVGLLCAHIIWWLNSLPYFQRMTFLDTGIRRKGV